jgi:DNA-binding transcriptional LysR family regulator
MRALAELDAAEAALDTKRRAPSGRLRVSVPVLFGRHCVAPVLLNLVHEYPQLSVEISFSDRNVDLFEEGFDLAVRIGELPDSASLMSRRLGIQRMGICAAPSYLATHGLPTNVKELDGHTGIVYGRSGQSPPWLVRDSDGAVYEPRINTRIRLDDLAAIADAALAGAGLAWLPCWLVAPHVRAGNLQLVMNSERVVATDIYAVWPRARYLSTKTRAAIDTLAVEVSQMMEYPVNPLCESLLPRAANSALMPSEHLV